MPVRQMAIPELYNGEIFAVGHGKEERRFPPTFAEASGDPSRELEEDVALLARVRNPFNYNRTLTICNGVHSRGVLGAVRTLTDARIREANELHLANRFPQGEFAVLLRVPVFQGAALSPDLENPDNILYAWPSQAEAKKTLKKDESCPIPSPRTFERVGRPTTPGCCARCSTARQAGQRGAPSMRSSYRRHAARRHYSR